MSLIAQRSRALAGANLIGVAGVILLVPLVPAIAGVVTVVRHPGLDTGQAGRTVLRQVRATLRRDLPMSLLASLCLVLGLVTTAIGLGWFGGGRRLLLLAVIAVVYLVLGGMLAAYAHAAGTLSTTSSRAEVMELAMRRLAGAPGRGLLAALVLVLVLPLWLIAPLALCCGIALPAWLHDALWRPMDDELLEDADDDPVE